MWIKVPFRNVQDRKSLIWIVLATVLLVGTLALGWTIYASAGETMKHHVRAGQELAVVSNSGSTNMPGWSLTIFKDGSGELHYEHVAARHSFLHTFEDRSYAAGTFDSEHLANLLAQIDDVSSIPDHGCMKSVSFGSKTTISYKGKTSGDLSCLSEKDEEQFLHLKHAVQNLPLHEQPGEQAGDML